MPQYQLNLGNEVLFQSDIPEDVARHVVKEFPPHGAFPSPNPVNSGFAIVLPGGTRLQGLRAEKWIKQQM